MTYLEKWIELDIIMLSEIIWTWKGKSHAFVIFGI